MYQACVRACPCAATTNEVPVLVAVHNEGGKGVTLQIFDNNSRAPGCTTEKRPNFDGVFSAVPRPFSTTFSVPHTLSVSNTTDPNESFIYWSLLRSEKTQILNDHKLLFVSPLEIPTSDVQLRRTALPRSTHQPSTTCSNHLQLTAHNRELRRRNPAAYNHDITSIPWPSEPKKLHRTKDSYIARPQRSTKNGDRLRPHVQRKPFNE